MTVYCNGRVYRSSPADVIMMLAPMITKELLEIVRCPACKAALRYDDAALTMACAGCRRIYPVRDGIPILLVDEARMPVE